MIKNAKSADLINPAIPVINTVGIVQFENETIL